MRKGRKRGLSGAQRRKRKIRWQERNVLFLPSDSPTTTPTPSPPPTTPAHFDPESGLYLRCNGDDKERHSERQQEKEEERRRRDRERRKREEDDRRRRKAGSARGLSQNGYGV